MRFYVVIAGLLALVSFGGYVVSLYVDSKIVKRDNEITKLSYEKNELEVQQKEADTQRAFTQEEKKIKLDSNKTRVYTKINMEDSDVQDFDDSW